MVKSTFRTSLERNFPYLIKSPDVHKTQPNTVFARNLGTLGSRDLHQLPAIVDTYLTTTDLDEYINFVKQTID